MDLSETFPPGLPEMEVSIQVKGKVRCGEIILYLVINEGVDNVPTTCGRQSKYLKTCSGP